MAQAKIFPARSLLSRLSNKRRGGAAHKQRQEPMSGLNLHNACLKVERLLCAMDLSPESQQALGYAVALARKLQAHLYICHCTDEPLPDGGMRLREHLQELMNAFSDPCPDWQAVIREGRPDQALPLVAAELNIDLIVMNTRRRPYTAALMGSTAEALARAAPCSLLVLHAEEREQLNRNLPAIEIARILVAQDFSAAADLALHHAFALAGRFGSELHLLNVLPETTAVTAGAAVQQALQRLHELAPNSDVADKIRYAVREGRAHREILAYAEEKQIELICMGAHGEGKRAQLGTVADRVIRQANCPVLITRPAIREQVEEKKFYKVLVATDGSQCGEAAVRAAAARRWPAGTLIRVLTVMEPLSTLGPAATHYQHSDELLNALDKVAAAAAARLAGYDRVVDYEVCSGFAADTILAMAKDWDADLVMVGTHGRRGLSRLLLGSVAERVAAHAPCSVEIVREKHRYKLDRQ